MNAMVPVADKVMSCIAVGLGLDKDFFKEVWRGLCHLHLHC